MHKDGKTREVDMGVAVPASVTTSISATRKLLCVYAERTWGGTEGREYAIGNYPPHTHTVSLFARHRTTGETIHIAPGTASISTNTAGAACRPTNAQKT
jgi:hypothetical protein